MGKVVSVFVAEVASGFLFQNVGIDKGDIPDLAKVSEGGEEKCAALGLSLENRCCLTAVWCLKQCMKHRASLCLCFVTLRVWFFNYFFYALEPCKKPHRPHNLLRCNTSGSCWHFERGALFQPLHQLCLLCNRLHECQHLVIAHKLTCHFIQQIVLTNKGWHLKLSCGVSVVTGFFFGIFSTIFGRSEIVVLYVFRLWLTPNSPEDFCRCSVCF